LIKSIYFLALSLFFVLTTGCKTTKNLEQGPPPARSQKEVMDALLKRNIDFTWFAAKGDADFDSETMAGSGTIALRIKKDSLIWMQGKKFGIEGFRGIINKDSVYMVNRLEKYYIGEAIKSLHSSFGLDLDFQDIQQLLAGNVFLPSQEEIKSYVQEGKDCKLSSNTAGYNITYTCSAYDLQLYTMIISDNRGHKINVSLSDYRKFGKIKIPFTRNFTFQSLGDTPYFLNVKVDELEVNEEKQMPFTLPTHYKKMRI
jgi:Domain of unknown function (DUF4292)